MTEARRERGPDDPPPPPRQLPLRYLPLLLLAPYAVVVFFQMTDGLLRGLILFLFIVGLGVAAMTAGYDSRDGRDWWRRRRG